jgi:transposase-like protein
MNAAKTVRSITQHSLQDPGAQGNPADLRFLAVDPECQFPNDDACLEYIKELRWPNSVTRCGKCNMERKHSRVTGRTAYACNHCGNHIYPLKGTVFSRSSTSLKTWFYVIHLIASAQSEITAKTIQRKTGVTYKTAWRMLRQLRHLIVNRQPELAQSIIRKIVTPNIFRIPQKSDLVSERLPETGFTNGAA